jgi:hypothetical protein
MRRRPERLVAVTAVLVGGVVGACAADPEDPAPGPTEGTTSSSSEPSVTSPVAEDSDYLPVPEGVELTPQGSELALRDSAVVAWEPRQELVGVLDVTVTRLERTSFAESFQGWQLDEATRRSTPYFVRATVANAGETDVGGHDVPLYAVDAADTLIQASTFQTRFDPCPGNGVFRETFAPGDAEGLCLVYLVPDGGELTAVSFRPVEDFDPITWTGKVTEPDKS